MGMVPEVAVAMLACARIGAVHTVIFGGFAAEAIARAGFVLHVDCPDLALSRHTGFQDLTDSEFLKQAESQIEVLNHSLRNVPREQVRLHICWGNYEGPHTHDIALAMTVAEKILIMRSGEIVDSGTPLELLAGEVHPYTRELLETMRVIKE